MGALTRAQVNVAYNGPNGVMYVTTNFLSCIPFSTDDDFQGGLSSPASNINFKITGQVYYRTGDAQSLTTQLTTVFLIDGCVMI